MRAELSAPTGYKYTMLLLDQLAWYNWMLFPDCPCYRHSRSHEKYQSCYIKKPEILEMPIYTFSVNYVRSMLEVTLHSKHKLLSWATLGHAMV
jgi:hypothetical protein